MLRKRISPYCLYLALACFLAGCSSKLIEPYAEPAPGTPTATLRVITNGGVMGSPYKGCLGDLKSLAIAGRFSNGSPSINYIQQPEHPPSLQLPARIAPPMPELPPVLRRSEGSYGEIIADYRLPAGTPFLLHSIGAVAATHGNAYASCSSERGVFEFKENKHYEMVAGMLMHNDKEGRAVYSCIFSVYELMQMPGTDLYYQIKLEHAQSSENTCINE